MNTNSDGGSGGVEIYWDSFNPDISANPYSLYKRMRDEAPLYYNETHDFYAVSRFADVERCLGDHQAFSSARGDIFEIIKANIEVPSGMFIWEDPPEHTAYRSIVSRVFTPKRLRSSTDLIWEPPRRASSIRPTVRGPIPGIRSRSRRSARFISTGSSKRKIRA